MNNAIHVFPDTNVFLHYPPLSNIDWRQLCNSKSVHLVVCLEVIHELDDKKSDTRLASRAERAIKEIREAFRSNVPIRDQVTLSIFNHELRHSDFPESLSPDSSDDKIVHLAKVYRDQHSECEVAVATEDLGMELRCEANGIPVIRMVSATRMENPQDELSKKYKQNVQELAAIKNRLPKLRLGIGHRDKDAFSDPPPQFTVNDRWQAADIDAEVDKQRRQYPKQAEKKSRVTELGGPRSMSAIARASLHMYVITDEQWKDYDSRLDNYFNEYRRYIENRNLLEDAKARCITFDLVLQNAGNGLATDVDVIVSWPAAVCWLAKSGETASTKLETRMDIPQPPEEPKPMSSMEYLRRSDADVLSSIRMAQHDMARMSQLDFAHRGDEFTPVAKLVKASNNTMEIHARLQKMKHGHTSKLGTFLAVFASWEVALPLSVPFVISTSELSEKVEGRLPVIVRSVSQVGDAT